jgi:hypothetical protein
MAYKMAFEDEGNGQYIYRQLIKLTVIAPWKFRRFTWYLDGLYRRSSPSEIRFSRALG